MKISRAIPVILVSLAGGIGLRLAFAIPAHADGRARGPIAQDASSANAGATPGATAGNSSSRPAESEMLAAKGGARLRLLVAWLPGAGRDELLRIAKAFSDFKVDNNYDCLRIVMVRWAEVDPRGMLEWARKDGASYVQDAINAWARVDFDSAWAAAAGGQPDSRSAALLGLTATDPAKCLRVLREDPSLLGLTGFIDFLAAPVMQEVLERLAGHDPAAVAALLDKAAPKARKALADHFALAWAKADPAAAVAWMSALESEIRDRLLKESGVWIAEHAPQHLPGLLAKLPAGRMRSALQAAGLAKIAVADPDAARRQIDAMPAGPAKQYGKAMLLTALCRSGDDAGAAALAAEIGWTIQNEWCPSYAVSLYGVNLDSGSTHNSDEAEAAGKALQHLIGRIASKDPAQAAALLEKYGPIGTSGDPAAHPAAMMEAIQKTGDSFENKEWYLSGLAGAWMMADPAASAAWAAAHSGQEQLFMKKWASHPSAILEWASFLPVEKRVPLLEGSIKSWKQGNGTDILAVIRGSKLPEEEKQKLLSLVPQP